MTARRLGALIAALAVLLGVAPRAHAQEAPPVRVEASFLPSAATVGDRVILEVRVTHPADVLVSVPRPVFPATEVVSQTPPVESPQLDGTVLTTVTWTLQPFTLRTLDSGPIPVRWLRSDGSGGIVEGAPVALPITPTRALDDEQLRPLKPQETVPGAPPALVRPATIGAAVAALLTVAALLAWSRLRRREAPVPPRVDGPEERARALVDGLRGLALDSEEAFQTYYGTIALAVRSYLGERFRFNAVALTTPELERRMTRHGVDRWQARLVAGLLERCDAAVYARRYPEATSADHDLTVAYEIIELGRPPEVAPAVAGVPA
ncbi:MAG: hypothetical protein AMXMBFR23_14100 [Chloroflexota bacterium]